MAAENILQINFGKAAELTVTGYKTGSIPLMQTPLKKF